MFALIGYSMLHNFFGTYQGKRNQRRFPFDESFRFEFPKISRKDGNLAKYIEIFGNFLPSLRSWRDFARECFSFGSEAVNASGEAVRGLVKSRVEFAAREIPCGLRPRGIWRLRRHSPAHESRQLRRLFLTGNFRLKGKRPRANISIIS